MPPLNVAPLEAPCITGGEVKGAIADPPGRYDDPAGAEVFGENCVAVRGVSGKRLGNCTRWARNGSAASATSNTAALK